MKYKNFISNLVPNSNVFIHPFIIAEAGVNHEGSLDTAKLLIDQAADNGADAIKFQTYKASTIASVNSPAYWDTTKETTQSQYQLFKKHDKFWKKEMEILANYSQNKNIEFMSTPFDHESAIFLNDMQETFKISSSDLTNKPLIDLISSFQKPIILSTGASYLHEIQETMHWLKDHEAPIALLHCVLNYPTPDHFANLNRISALINQFPCVNIGYSDHTLPGNMDNLIYSVLLGAVIIEKHFTHDKSLKGNDHYHAMDATDLKVFITKLENLQQVLGNYDCQPHENEQKSIKNARRGIYFARDLEPGHIIAAEDIICKRPSTEIMPKYFDSLVGKVIQTSVKSDDAVNWRDMK